MKYHKTYKRFDRMISKHLGVGGLGGEITITSVIGDPEYNPNTGEVEEVTLVQNSTAVRMDARNKLFGEATLVTDDAVFYLPKNTLQGCELIAPKVLDSIVFDDTKYVVSRSDPWNFSGMLLGYKIRAKIAS